MSVPSRKSGKRGGKRLGDGTRLADHGARRHREIPRGEPIVFVDCPDPDNFVLVVAANLLRGCTRVVLTGRPANFGIKSRPFSVRTCARAADEVDVESDAVLALRATAAHLKSVAASQGCSELKIYDGGVAPDAPVAHAEHVHEFLFGRSDLGASDQGVLTIDSYRKIVADLDAKDDRGPALRTLLASRLDDLLPLSQLVEDLDGKVECLVGGPFTALAELCDDDARVGKPARPHARKQRSGSTRRVRPCRTGPPAHSPRSHDARSRRESAARAAPQSVHLK